MFAARRILTNALMVPSPLFPPPFIAPSFALIPVPFSPCTDPVLDRLFTKKADAYIMERNDGGVYYGQHSPEACAQLCLNDVCCKSFDAGRIGSYREYDCFLSYSNRNDAGGDFVQNAGQLLDYFEKKSESQLHDVMCGSEYGSE